MKDCKPLSKIKTEAFGRKRTLIVQNAKICYLCAASLMFALGLFMLLFPEITARTLFCYIIGGVSIVLGGTKIFGFYSNDMYRLAFQFDLAIGIFAALIGLLLIINPQGMSSRFISIYNIYVIFDGLFKLQTALDARKFGMKWQPILATAIVITGLGIFTLIDPFPNHAVLTLNNMTGVLLMADASENIWVTAYTVRVRAHKKNFSERFGDFEI